MFDIGLSEIIVIAVIALFVVGPKDIPRLLYRLGKLMRTASNHWNSMRNTLGDVMHEAELNEYREKAKEQKDKAVKELLGDFEPEKAVDEALRSAAVKKTASEHKKKSVKTKAPKAAKKNG